MATRAGHIVLSLLVLTVVLAFGAPKLGYGPAGGEVSSTAWPSGAPKEAEPYRSAFQAAAKATDVPLGTLLGVGWAESGFNQKARSAVGARGVMQLMPTTALGLKVNPDDAADNIMGGARYLSQLYRTFGSWELAFAAYNAGPGAVQDYGGIPPYEETMRYVENVQGYIAKLGPVQYEAGTGNILTRTAAWWTWAGTTSKNKGYNHIGRGADVVAGFFTWTNDQKQVTTGEKGARIAAAAEKWADRNFNPGVFGQCAVFVRQVLKDANVTLSPEVTEQTLDGTWTGPAIANSFGADQGTVITELEDLLPGDIVMFDNTYGSWPEGNITHVGIYVGDGMMIDRATLAAPVQRRPVTTFSTFHGAVRVR